MADTKDRVATRLAEMRLLAHQRRNGHHRRREEGQILVLFTIAIIVIMLFASIVIDLGMLRNNRQILVNAVDSAALAGGTKMPVNGCVNKSQPATSNCSPIENPTSSTSEFYKVNALVTSTLTASYPGITGANYTISYRCLIGIDSSNQPYLSRDIPAVCNPRMALGHTPVAADFKGAGPTRYSICRPDLGDKCNVVVVSGATNTAYSFGRVVGVNQGSTGTVASAACNGPCGQPPAAPVDLVVIIDRTSSMSSTQITNARNAAKAVLGVYDPALQRVAIGFLGPSESSTTCSGGGSGPPVHVNTFTGSTTSPPTLENSTTGTTVSAGATSINVAKPGSISNGDLLVASISVRTNIVTSGAGTRLTPPSPAPAGWTLIRTTNNGTTVSLNTYYHVVTNTTSEPALNYTWTFTDQAGTPVIQRATGAILHFNNVDTADPIDVDGGNTGSDSFGTINATANQITTNNDDVRLIAFLAMASAGGSGSFFGSWTNSMSEAVDIRGTNAANGPSLGVATKADTNNGPTGNTTSTLDSGGSYAAQHVSINPIVGDTYGWAYPADLSKWIPIGFTGTDTDTPTLPGSVANGHRETYSDGNGTVYSNTHITSAINCFDYPGGTSTNLTVPMQMAAQYLQQYGRPDVKWGILFETDGEPNYSGWGIQATQYTCQSFVNAANAAKAITNAQGQHIEVFTVGFLDPGSDPNCPDGTGSYPSTAYNGDNISLMLANAASTNLSPSPNGSANGCIAAENTDQDHFFCQPNNTELTTVFRTIATTFAGIRTHLVQIDPLPIIYSISPTTGTGGTTINITGKYFTGVNSGCAGCGVTFGGVSRTVTFLSDTSIRITAPAGAPLTADIVVTTPTGASIVHSGAKFVRT